MDLWNTKKKSANISELKYGRSGISKATYRWSKWFYKRKTFVFPDSGVEKSSNRKI